MNVVESRGVRHLIVRAESGEELPSALANALEAAEARTGRLSGTAVLDNVEIASIDRTGARISRRIDSPVMAISLEGSASPEGATTNVRLHATIVREGQLGLETFAGEIVSARALSLEVFVTALDDVAPLRRGEERAFVAPTPQSAPAAAAPAPAPALPVEPPAAFTARAPPPSPITPPTPLPTPTSLPARPATRHEEVEVYPETGDLVSHFHFGECEVIGSDGERIRLRQEKDGRVREVALGMLKIESPTTDPASGKRHFRLSRKH